MNPLAPCRAPVSAPSHLRVGAHSVPLTVMRVKRARRYSLRYRPLTRDVLLTVPVRASLAEGLKFAQSREGWLLSKVEEAAGRVEFTPGARIPLLGSDYVLVHAGAGRGVARLEGGELRVFGAEAFFSRRVRDFIQAQARGEIVRRAEEKAALLGVSIRSIRLRDTASRWGSCSAAGDVSFSWRLAFAPVEVLDYLVAHEIAHLREMNHSPAFWALVAQLCPDYRTWRDWLKEEGSRLYRYG